MAVLYIDEQGCSLYRDKGVLIVKKDKELLKEIPIAQVDKIILVGGIHLSSGALRLILDNSIFTSFITTNGKYKGSLFGCLSKNVNIRIEQFKKFYDNDFREKFSRTIALNKIKNLYSFLLKYKRNHKDCNIDIEISKLKQTIERLKKVTRIKIQQLLGIEGISAKYYFSAFGRMLRKDFSFKKRTSHPPRGRVNSLLSLGYTLLFNEFVGLIYSNGLDPFIGYFHNIEYGRESLAVDLMEEFRFIVDSLVIKLINKNIITKNDFLFDSNAGFYKLSDKSRKIFYEKYEKKLLTEIKIGENKIYNYHKLFNLQIQKFSKFLVNPKLIYKPYSYK